MSDTHGHDSHGDAGHAEHAAPAASNNAGAQTVDQLFNKIQDYIGQKISTFIAFLFSYSQ